MKEILRSYKFRIYPNAEQKEQLAQTFGCARFVYNWALSNKKEAYENNIKKSANDVSKELTALKKDPNFIWLKDVSSVCLQQSLMNLDNAYQRFFKKQGGFPTFKKRSNRQSARYVKSAFTFKNGQLKLAKQAKFMKVKFSRPLTGEVSSITVSKDPDGKYFASKRFDIENGKRLHIATAGALLNESISNPKLDYKVLLHLTGYLTQDSQQVDEMFQRMVFNVLTDNKDDHVKNFSFICREGKWSLAPAYDLTLCKEGYHGEHATSANNKGNPDIEDMLAVGESIRIPRRKGMEIINHMINHCQEILSTRFE